MAPLLVGGLSKYSEVYFVYPKAGAPDVANMTQEIPGGFLLAAYAAECKGPVVQFRAFNAGQEVKAFLPLWLHILDAGRSKLGVQDGKQKAPAFP